MTNSSYLGTPGVGKSLLSRILCRKTGLTCIEVSNFAIQKGCLEEYDEVYECPILDEEKVIYKRNFNEIFMNTIFFNRSYWMKWKTLCVKVEW